jgi:hypothetical protein
LFGKIWQDPYSTMPKEGIHAQPEQLPRYRDLADHIRIDDAIALC